MNVELLPHQVHEVAALAAAGVEDAHFPGDAAAEELIEQVDVDVAELLAEPGGGGVGCCVHRGPGRGTVIPTHPPL